MKKKLKPILFLIAFVLINQITASAGVFCLEKQPETKEVPVIMYHLITKNSKYLGSFGISPSEMEQDLKYLSDNGYQTIVMSDLIDFVDGNEDLPEKPIILTFDDGMSSDYNYLLPLLKQYEMKAVSSVVVKLADEYSNIDGNKPHLGWQQIEELHNSKYVEIQNHSYDLHGNIGSAKRQGESEEAYQIRLKEDLSKAQLTIKEKLDFEPTTFAYPLGKISSESRKVLEELDFKASLSCREGMNVIKQYDNDCLFHIKRNIRPSGRPISEILEKIEQKQR